MGLCKVIRVVRVRLTVLSIAAALCGCGAPLEPSYSGLDGGGWTGVLLATTGGTTTSAGELVRIDIDAGNAEFLGRVGTPGDIGPAWTGISFDPNGDLFVSSSQFSEIPELGCQGLFGSCAHIYKIDPTNGAFVAEMGTTGFGHVSDIDFSRTTLYANFDDKTAIFGTGGVLATIDPVSGAATPVGTGFGPADLNRNLLNGGLSVDPVTCDIWVVERNNRVSGQDNRIFRVDPNTGEALPPTVPLGLGGNPAGFGLDALEILPDGRFIGTRAGFSSSSSNVYLINPEPDPTGFANLTLIPISLPPELEGKLNGLESRPYNDCDDDDGVFLSSVGGEGGRYEGSRCWSQIPV